MRQPTLTKNQQEQILERLAAGVPPVLIARDMQLTSSIMMAFVRSLKSQKHKEMQDSVQRLSELRESKAYKFLEDIATSHNLGLETYLRGICKQLALERNFTDQTLLSSLAAEHRKLGVVPQRVAPASFDLPKPHSRLTDMISNHANLAPIVFTDAEKLEMKINGGWTDAEVARFNSVPVGQHEALAETIYKERGGIVPRPSNAGAIANWDDE